MLFKVNLEEPDSHLQHINVFNIQRPKDYATEDIQCGDEEKSKYVNYF